MGKELEEIESILYEAIGKGDAEVREAYLAKTCGTNTKLRAEIDSLLSAYTDETGILKAPLDLLKEPNSTLTETSGMLIDRYKLLEKIGEGGMAVVYMAEQERPIQRKVALKIIKLGMDTKSVIARFEAERQALAMMDHSNIARVLDAGSTETGRPYFVMELVTGVSITEYCDKNNLSTKQRLNLFILVCNAVQHAHQKGIIHRDIKPTNVMVTLHDSKPIPKVIDFGIAKAINQKLTEKTLFTRYAHIIGTPAYMSPEQAQMSGLDIDTRTDIYSLGVLLYELLTGTTPFETEELSEASLSEMQRIICEEEPAKPSTKLSSLKESLFDIARHRSANPDILPRLIKGDLDWIVMKCLEKDRNRRFETANELVADIRRHLENEPVVARPPSAAYRFQKAWRRNKVAYIAAVMVAASLIIGISLSLWQASIANTARKIAVQNEHEARQSEINALRRAYNSDMSQAFRALEENLIGRVQESVNQYIPNPGEPDFRGWEWRYAWAQSQSDAALTWDTSEEMGRVFALRISPDQRYMVTSGFQTGPTFRPHVRCLWNFQTREQLKHVRLPGGSARGFAFSNSGKYLALHHEGANDTHEIHIYNTTTWELETVILSQTEVSSLSFSPDDKTLAAFTYSEAVLWDWHRREVVHQWPVRSSWWGRHDITFFPDGHRLAVGGVEELKIVDIVTGRILYRQPTQGEDTRLAISPDSRYLAIGYGFVKCDIDLLNTDSWEQQAPLTGHNAWVMSLTFTPNGKQLISANADHTLRVWDMQRRVTTRVLKGHQSGVQSVSVISDASRAISAGEDGRILEWDLNAPLPQFSEHLLAEKVVEVVFSADNRFFYTVDKKGSVGLWDSNKFSKELTLSQELGPHSSIILSPNGEHLIVGTGSGQLWILDAKDLQVVAHRKVLSGQIFPVGFSTDGTFLITLEFGNKISMWNTETWQLISSVETGLNFRYFRKTRYAIPQGTDILLCVSGDSDLVWWDLVQSKVLARIDVKSRGFDNEFAVSPTEPLLASIAAGDYISLWDLKTSRFVGEVRGPRDFHGVAYSPDGRRMVTGSSGKGVLRLWDVSTRQEVARLGTDITRTLTSVQFSPDGNMICAINKDQSTYFLRAPSFESISAVKARNSQTERR